MRWSAALCWLWASCASGCSFPDYALAVDAAAGSGGDATMGAADAGLGGQATSAGGEAGLGGAGGGGTHCDAGSGGGCALDPCSDGSLSAGETDVDCGGSCEPCVGGKACKIDGDCLSDTCTGSVCEATLGFGYYTVSKQDSEQEIRPLTRIESRHPDPLPLEDIKVRYYLTMEPDSTSLQYSAGDITGVRTVALSVDIIPLTPAVATADTFIELGFGSDAGVLQPGETVTLDCILRSTSGANFDQTNDYSFDSGPVNYAPTDTVTLYVAGELVSGTPP